MTKSELIKRLSKRYPNLYRKDIERMVHLIFDKISASLKEKARVELRGFGSFSVRQRDARQVRNPRTGKTTMLNQHHVVYFRAGKEFNDQLNDVN